MDFKEKITASRDSMKKIINRKLSRKSRAEIPSPPFASVDVINLTEDRTDEPVVELVDDFVDLTKPVNCFKVVDLTKNWETVNVDLTEEWESMKVDLTEELDSVKVDLTEEWESMKVDLTEELDSVKVDLTEEWESMKVDIPYESLDLLFPSTITLDTNLNKKNETMDLNEEPASVTLTNEQTEQTVEDPDSIASDEITSQFNSSIHSLAEDTVQQKSCIPIDEITSHSEPLIHSYREDTVLHESSIPMDAENDLCLKYLTEQLHSLHNKITILESAEVDFGEEADSSFVIISEHKRRAWQIYEKINRLTGKTETIAKGATKFDGTPFEEFNRALEEMVYKDGMFPNGFAALKCLKLFNRNHNYQLTDEDCLEIVEKALTQIQRTLQKQRNVELFETFSFYTNGQTDPALDDEELKAKLNENKNIQNQKFNLEIF